MYLVPTPIESTYRAVILLYAETETLMWLICNESIAHHTVESLVCVVSYLQKEYEFSYVQ